MSTPMILAILWVLAATGTAMLPMRRQYVPGLALLLVAPVLMIWLGMVHGWLTGLAALVAFTSMMRRPLRYLWKRARGVPTEPPE